MSGMRPLNGHDQVSCKLQLIVIQLSSKRLGTPNGQRDSRSKDCAEKQNKASVVNIVRYCANRLGIGGMTSYWRIISGGSARHVLFFGGKWNSGCRL